MADPDDRVRRRLRTLQRVVGAPSDAVLARRSGLSAATFSEVMSGKRSPREEFVGKVVAGCVVSARANGQAPMDVQRVLHALRLPGHTASDSGLLERDDELDRCSAVLEAVRDRVGATVVIEGPAGIGKSQLLAQVCTEAAVRGVVPLAVRGNQRDQTMAFGAARTLLARWVAGHGERDRRALFAGAADFARLPLGVPRARQRGPESMIGLTEALYWLVVNATSLLRVGSGADGLLLAVDDAHWLDEESLRWLEFLADRLAGLPVVVLLAHRPHERPTLTRITLRAAEVVRPRPLGPAAVRTMVHRGPPAHRTPGGEPDDRFCAALLDRSGGNPFYLHWMLDMARERGLKPTAADAELVGTLTPRHVVQYLSERLAGLGPAARSLAQAGAVLGPGHPLGDTALLAGLATAESKREYDRLCEAAILAPGSTVDFRHPIIHSAVYDDIDPSLRSDLHLAAARLLHDRHAAPDAVAAHLLDVHAAGDPWVAGRMTAAAEDALGSGLAATAARYLKRAIDEPPPMARQGRVRLRYGQALALEEVAAALPALRAAYRQATDDVLRTDAAVALAKAHSYADRLGDGVRLLDAALDHCADERQRQRLLAEQLLWATWWDDDPLRADRMALLDRIAPPLTGGTDVERLLIVLHAWSLVLRGRPRAEGFAAVERVIRRGVVFADVDQGMEIATMTGFVHLYAGAADVAHGLFDQAVDEFERHGWRGTHLAFAHANRGHSALRLGRLDDAVADTGIALRLALRSGSGTPAEWFATGTLVETLLARGEVDAAVAVCADRGYRERRPDAVVLPVPEAVAGALSLAQGRPGRAAAILRTVGNRLDAASMTNPAVCGWRFGLAAALRHSAPEEARQVASEAAQLADRFGDPVTRGRALRTLAAVDADRAALLEESARLLRSVPDRWQYLQTLAQLGAEFARSGHTEDARRTFTEALALADEGGALALRKDLARHLGTIGVTAEPPPRVNALSPRARRVAQLAAEGRSEAEIAHKLVLDLDTVRKLELSAADRLGTDSRAGLRRALEH
ncbi:AAA family ATPase [Amycolatopsis sp. A133]|uniref:ATP-binding protein n=1 Tax=Amycolatopsis sp. A133 TaxID=3064472 RepID=UPI0027F7A7B4|nr:AAA family ATPase [Amycolatopsis sp. A133]MDQ7808574.1 AAA family ATPase [Amycolatopsis sp. A133]